MTQLPFRSATELVAAIRGKEISSTELAECYLDRIEAVNPGLGAVVTVAAERACPEAGEAGRRLARGEEAGPLHGLPVTVKDRLETAGMPATCGARELAGYVAGHDAEAVGRLRRAGADHRRQDKLAGVGTGLLARNGLFGTTSNPWDAWRTPGGSSGGAPAVAAARPRRCRPGACRHPHPPAAMRDLARTAGYAGAECG